MCVCVCVWPYSEPEVILFWWGRSCAWYTPLLALFVVVPSRSLTNRAGLSLLAMLSTLAGNTLSFYCIQLLERHPSQMVDKLGAQDGPTTLLVLTCF